MVGLGIRQGRPRNLEAIRLAKVIGKELATTTLRAGAILLNLIDAISDVSDVDPAAHLSAMFDSHSEAEHYRARLARAADDLLFRELGDLPTSEVPLLRFLQPQAEMPLYQAFKWANSHGYGGASRETVIRMVDLPHPFTRAYFNEGTFDTWSCYLVKGSSGRNTLPLGYDETTLVGTGVLLIASNHSVDQKRLEHPSFVTARQAVEAAIAGVVGNATRDDTLRALHAVRDSLYQ